MRGKLFWSILVLSLIPAGLPSPARAQTALSAAALKPTPTSVINTPLARDEEEYYQGLVSDRHPVVWGAVILMGLAWGGFLVFFSYKFLKTKPRPPEAVEKDDAR